MVGDARSRVLTPCLLGVFSGRQRPLDRLALPPLQDLLTPRTWGLWSDILQTLSPLVRTSPPRVGRRAGSCGYALLSSANLPCDPPCLREASTCMPVYLDQVSRQSQTDVASTMLPSLLCDELLVRNDPQSRSQRSSLELALTSSNRLQTNSTPVSEWTVSPRSSHVEHAFAATPPWSVDLFHRALCSMGGSGYGLPHTVGTVSVSHGRPPLTLLTDVIADIMPSALN